MSCVQCREGADGSQHEKQLYGTLLRGYSRHARPVKRHVDPVRVRVAFSLVEVLSIDENTGQLAVKAWLTMVGRRLSFADVTSGPSSPFFCSLFLITPLPLLTCHMFDDAPKTRHKLWLLQSCQLPFQQLSDDAIINNFIIVACKFTLMTLYSSVL